MVPYALTILIGLTLGALGSGGAILMLPMLVYVGGYSPAVAVAMSLAVISVTSFAGALAYVREGGFNWKVAAVFGIGGVIGAFLGSLATPLVPPAVLMLIFGMLLLLVGIRTLRDKATFACPNPCLPPRCFFVALGIGLLTGFLGVGGGFLLIPALTRFAGLSQRRAVGTSLSLIGLNSLAGLAGHLRHAVIDWKVTGALLGFALVGLLTGYLVSRRLPEPLLKSAFGWLLIFIGTLVLSEPWLL